MPVKVKLRGNAAMETVKHKDAGLHCNADDSLTKPFAFEELLARIEALLRRAALHSARRGCNSDPAAPAQPGRSGAGT